MEYIWHVFLFSLGFLGSLIIARYFDMFCNNLGSKFWTWKVRHFKDEWTGK